MAEVAGVMVQKGVSGSIAQKGVTGTLVGGGAYPPWVAYWENNPPLNLAVVWVDDYAQMTWDISDTRGQYEIWQELNGGGYELVATTAEGASSYNNYTWQNASMNFKVRGIGGGVYSEFTDVVNLVTPLVFKSDQTTPGTLNFEAYLGFNLVAGKTVNVNWDDGTNNDYTLNTNPTHTYTEGGIYYVKMTGDLNSIKYYMLGGLGIKAFGDVSKWILSPVLIGFRVYNTNISGNCNAMELPATCKQFYVGGSLISGLPRGVYTAIDSTTGFDTRACPVKWDEMDAWLKYVLVYLTAHPPTVNARYQIGGCTSAQTISTNTDIAGIVACYTGAGKTCTFTFNGMTIAYSRDETREEITIENDVSTPVNSNAHPNIVNIGSQWNGYQYWMCNTPYPDGTVEKPWIYASNDGVTWVVPAGLTNPIEAGSSPDPELYYEAGKLYCVYIQSLKTYIQESSDGINWSAKIEICNANCGSPSIVKDGATYYIYYHGAAGGTLYRRPCATIDGTYGAEEACVLPIYAGTYWHRNVRIIGGKFYCVTSKTSGQEIWIGVSDDGVNFTVEATGLMLYCADRELEDKWDYTSYKPALVYIGDQLYMYYSTIAFAGGKYSTARMKIYLI